jgi:hypothetical protein
LRLDASRLYLGITVESIIAEFDKKAVASRLDQPAIMLGGHRIEQLRLDPL